MIAELQNVEIDAGMCPQARVRQVLVAIGEFVTSLRAETQAGAEMGAKRKGMSKSSSLMPSSV